MKLIYLIPFTLLIACSSKESARIPEKMDSTYIIKGNRIAKISLKPSVVNFKKH
jgi:hypothetical protein